MINFYKRRGQLSKTKRSELIDWFYNMSSLMTFSNGKFIVMVFRTKSLRLSIKKIHCWWIFCTKTHGLFISGEVIVENSWVHYFYAKRSSLVFFQFDRSSLVTFQYEWHAFTKIKLILLMIFLYDNTSVD